MSQRMLITADAPHQHMEQQTLQLLQAGGTVLNQWQGPFATNRGCYGCRQAKARLT